MAIESCDCLTIYTLDVTKAAGRERWEVELRLVPGGRIHLSCRGIEGDFDPEAVQKAAAAVS